MASQRRKCPSCGKETRAVGSFCPFCSKSMDPKDPLYTATLDTTTNHEEEDSMMNHKKRCTQCGMVMAMTCSFCSHCGTNELEVIESEKKEPASKPVPPTPEPTPMPVPPTSPDPIEPAPKPVEPKMVPRNEDPKDDNPDDNNEEDNTVETRKSNPWWIIGLIAAIIATVLITLWVSGTERDKALQAERIASLEATLAQQAENPATVYLPTGTTKEEADAAAMAAASVNYDGWAAGETKDLQPGWSARGDVTVNGVKYYDEGGINEATVVVNRSSSPVRVYSQWGAGEVELLSYSNSEMAKQEFDRGGDYDASSVRIVEITDNEIVETWYRYKSGVVALTKTLVHNR